MKPTNKQVFTVIAIMLAAFLLNACSSNKYKFDEDDCWKQGGKYSWGQVGGNDSYWCTL